MAIDLTGKMFVQRHENGFVPEIVETCSHPHDGVHVGIGLTVGCPDCDRVSREALAAFAATGTTEFQSAATQPERRSVVTPVRGRHEVRPVEITAESALALVAAAEQGRKFELGDMTDTLVQAAGAWLRSYTGSFEFLTDMKARLGTRGLSFGQAKGVLNCMRAEIARNGRKADEAAQPVAEGRIDFKAIPDGRYAVEHGAETAYYVISTTKNGSGKRHVCILASDERIYVGTILPSGEYRGRHENLLREIARDPKAAGLLFGQTIGRCCRCGRTLTDASSREAGIGPECASKGWA